MKKIFFTLAVGSVLALVACGSDTTSISETETASTPTEAAEVNEEQAEAEEVPEEVEEVVEETDEDVQEDNTMKATNIYTDKELGISGEVGGMLYEVSGIQLKVIEPKDQYTADLFEVGIGEEVHGFTVELSGENTNDEDMSFYLGQVTAITNTKEQVEPDMILSEYIDGEYLGQVRHEGYNFYILKNSTVQELETIELRVPAPMNSNFDFVGEEVSEVIEINK